MPNSLSKQKLIIAATVSTLSVAFLVLYILQKQKKKKTNESTVSKNKKISVDEHLEEEKGESQEPDVKSTSCAESENKTDEENTEVLEEKVKANEDKIEECVIVEAKQIIIDFKNTDNLNGKENEQIESSNDSNVTQADENSFEVDCSEKDIVFAEKDKKNDESPESVDSQSGLSSTDNTGKESYLSDNDVKDDSLTQNDGVENKIDFEASLADSSRPDSGIQSCENGTSNTSSDCELTEQNKTELVINKEEGLQVQESRKLDVLYTEGKEKVLKAEKEELFSRKTSNEENVSFEETSELLLQNLNTVSCCEDTLQNNSGQGTEVEKTKNDESVSETQHENKVVTCEDVSTNSVSIIKTNCSSTNKSENGIESTSSQEQKSDSEVVSNKSVITEDPVNVNTKSVKAACSTISSRCSNKSSKKEWDDNASSSSNEISNSIQRRKPRHKKVQSKVSNNKSDEEIVEVFVEFPSELVGALIGKKGRNINNLKQYSEALVYIHELEDVKDYQVIQIKGTTSSIEKCASRIKRNFNVETLPQFKDTHKLNLQKTAASKQRHASNLGLQPSISLGYIYNQTIQQYLPVGGIVDVEVRNVTRITTLFVTPCKLLQCGYLDALNDVMASCYEHHHQQAPLVDRFAVNNGSFCVIKHNDAWCRAIVRKYMSESDELDVMLVDFGGYYRVPFSSARQIRQDMINIPFHAQECMLQNVAHIDDDADANNERIGRMMKMFNGGTFTYFAKIQGYNQAMQPLIKLFQHAGNNSNAKQINSELVKENIGKYVPATYNYSQQ